jgi:hypothetical protein
MKTDHNWETVNKLIVVVGLLATVFSCVIAILAFTAPKTLTGIIVQIAGQTAEPEIVYVTVVVEPTKQPITDTPKSTLIPSPIPPTLIPTPDLRVFWDDFEQGLKSDWITLQGYCTMSNGRLTCPEGNSRIEVGDFNWSNYKLTFDTGSYWIPGGAAVLIKINSSGAYLKLVIPVCNNAYWIYHGADGSEQNISNMHGGACENGTVRFEIDADQNGIYTTKINGSAIGTFQDTRMPTGRVGFQVNGPWFDNIEITLMEP